MAKQMKRYPAKFDREDDGRYSVFFLGSGMDGCITYGDDIEDARRNAQLNRIDNISFIEGKVEENLENLKDANLVILDPPRAGIMRQGIDDLLKIGAKTLVYVSCDPATLARDISLLSSKYEIEKVTPVDMFPNTYHVECVCILNLR